VRELRPETEFYKRLGFTVTYEDRNSVSIHYGDAISFGLYRKPDFQINDSQPLIWRIGVNSICDIYGRLMFYYGRQNVVEPPQHQRTGTWTIQYKSPSGYIVVFDGPIIATLNAKSVKAHEATNYTNTWGGYMYYFHGLDFIHPEDWIKYKPLQVHGWGLFHCSGETEDGYLILNRGDQSWRIQPDHYYVIPVVPALNYEDWVRDKELNRVGQIVSIEWHNKYRREYYILKVGRRISSKWNWPENLEKISTP
jgi:hypothetical protein